MSVKVIVVVERKHNGEVIEYVHSIGTDMDFAHEQARILTAQGKTVRFDIDRKARS